jgi:uncharacterized protein (TIGR01319 family)
VKIDVLVAEIGSTTTIVNAFHEIESQSPVFLGQGFAPTSVLEGDVRKGLEGAIESLKSNLKADTLSWKHIFASSSAAGGLRMTVHGLVYDMTVRAAREAALGAGANVHLVTAGRMRKSDIRKLSAIHPNIILIAGGVDYGERDIPLHNAELIAEALIMEGKPIPVIYAGNIENREDVREIFKEYPGRLALVENVYPRIDELVIEPTRHIIQEVFEEHIIHAPGMEHIRDLVDGPIIPTPGGVLAAAKVLKEEIGDLIVFDVGGATTDLHSVSEGSEEVSRLLVSPEPVAKRTVEGDLGVFINRLNILEMETEEKLSRSLGIKESEIRKLVENLGPIPAGREEILLVEELAKIAARTALERHAGNFRNLYGPQGKTRIAEGKDLTSVKYCIGTGGALTRLPDGADIIRKIIANHNGAGLYPSQEAEFLLDRHYTMASLGVLSKKYPQAAVQLMKESLGMRPAGKENV